MPGSPSRLLFVLREMLGNALMMRRANQEKIVFRVVLGLGMLDNMVDLIGPFGIAVFTKATGFIGCIDDSLKHIIVDRFSLYPVLDQLRFGWRICSQQRLIGHSLEHAQCVIVLRNLRN